MTLFTFFVLDDIVVLSNNQQADVAVAWSVNDKASDAYTVTTG